MNTFLYSIFSGWIAPILIMWLPIFWVKKEIEYRRDGLAKAMPTVLMPIPILCAIITPFLIIPLMGS